MKCRLNQGRGRIFPNFRLGNGGRIRSSVYTVSDNHGISTGDDEEKIERIKTLRMTTFGVLLFCLIKELKRRFIHRHTIVLYVKLEPSQNCRFTAFVFTSSSLLTCRTCSVTVIEAHKTILTLLTASIRPLISGHRPSFGIWSIRHEMRPKRRRFCSRRQLSLSTHQRNSRGDFYLLYFPVSFLKPQRCCGVAHKVCPSAKQTHKLSRSLPTNDAEILRYCACVIGELLTLS